MGKHNGKARSSGATVGSALVNKARKEGKGSRAAVALAGRHTTDATAYGRQSVLETNDLNEIMNMADLAGRDFAAERGEQAVVVSTGAPVSDKDRERDWEARAAAQEKNRHRLRIPRRPQWDRGTTAEQLDLAEREAFLAWRRDLAKLEEEESLILTPFEKNLEVWRQLWRVLERSHIIVQVIDARDPLTYRSTDLEEYARDINASKSSLLLLNKSDLLSEAARVAWADYLDSQGIPHIFWSAKLAAAEADDPEGDSVLRRQDCSDHRIRLLTCDQLLEVFSTKAREAAAADSDQQPPPAHAASMGEQRLVVGLTGYPNVGKSSTINALFGSKKTAVAATPGKTKHFQTLVINDQLQLCDCPGLVLPKYAHSKAEMVAAGVIPIDRLTDVRAPLDVVLQQAGIKQVEKVYNIQVPNSSRRMPSASDTLATLARGRGWTTGAGLPDEARAGRQGLYTFTQRAVHHEYDESGRPIPRAVAGLPTNIICTSHGSPAHRILCKWQLAGRCAPRVLKDFCDGKLVSFKMPPGHRQIGIAAATESAAAANSSALHEEANGAASEDSPTEDKESTDPSDPDDRRGVATRPKVDQPSGKATPPSADTLSGPGAAAPGPHSQQQSAVVTADFDDDIDISDADLALMQELNVQVSSGSRTKPQRAAHKFQNKGARRRAINVHAQAVAP